jgi:hypothetical protein
MVHRDRGEIVGSAAGVFVVGMAAWASAGAEAAVIYQNGNSTPVNAPVTTTQSYDVKFDGGSTDVNFGTNNFSSPGNYLKINLQPAPVASSAVADSGGFALALTSGATIGPAQNYSLANGKLYDGNTSPQTGIFLVGVPAYAGFQFTGSDNATHFGWVQFDVTDGSASSPVGNVIDYAYESTPNTAIAAGAVSSPEPGSLSLLAMGAVGMGLYRGRRRA